MYGQLSYFVDPLLLVSDSIQDRIKEYNYCKQFNCPPYVSLDKTPPKILDDFLIIEQEYNQCMIKKQRENNNA